jgi:hypothetical protein
MEVDEYLDDLQPASVGRKPKGSAVGSGTVFAHSEELSVTMTAHLPTEVQMALKNAGELHDLCGN